MPSIFSSQKSDSGPATRRGEGASILGPTNPQRAAQNPDVLSPPETDHGTLPNLKFSFADAHMRLEEGGWARQVTAREMPAATALAGVNMRLKAGAVRELHWHKEAEWAYMLAGRARITAIDQDGRTFADDVGEGDLWYFPGGIPHSIQGIGDDGCEFLLVFDDGGFSEDSTFLLTDWLAHTPRSVLAKNLHVPESALADIPTKERYIFPATMPGPLEADRLTGPTGPVVHSFSHRLHSQQPIRSSGGSVRVADSTNFPVATTIAAVLVEIEPGGLRELHWHPVGDEWQFYIQGSARMSVFAAEGKARTFDYQPGDVGYVPFAMGHYIENTGTTTVRYLEMFKSDRYADLSLTQWLALTPHQLVADHLNVSPKLIDALPVEKHPVVSAE